MYDISQIKLEAQRQFLSARALARKAKIPYGTVHRIFKLGIGHPETIGKLARALKMDPRILVVPDDIPDETETESIA